MKTPSSKVVDLNSTLNIGMHTAISFQLVDSHWKYESQSNILSGNSPNELTECIYIEKRGKPVVW